MNKVYPKMDFKFFFFFSNVTTYNQTYEYV